MTDYLERLLERLQEEEDETRDVPRLEEAVPTPKSRTDSGQTEPRTGAQASQAPLASQAPPERVGVPTALAGGAAEAAFPEPGITGPVGGSGLLFPKTPGGGPETVIGPLSARAARGIWSAIARKIAGIWPAAGETVGVRPTDAGETAGTGFAVPRKTAETSLERALVQAVDALERVENGPARTPDVPGLSAQWPAVSSSGAAGLARRLTQAALAAPPETARTLFAAEPGEKTAPSAGWEEFDRRLERDARRYDGGIELY